MTDEYPAHLKEQPRLSVASDLLRHEFKKLGISDSEAQRKQLSSLGTKDFWNLIDAIVCGYKLKDIVRWITAQNVTWSSEQVKVEQLTFTAQFDVLGHIQMAGQTGLQLKQDLRGSPDIFQALTVKVRKEYSEGLPRADDPIIVVREPEGSLRVYDGNGRTCLALVNEVGELVAHLGDQRKAGIENQWLPTRLLSDLADLTGKPSEKNLPQLMADVIGSSQNGLQDFMEIGHASDLLKQQVRDILGR